MDSCEGSQNAGSVGALVGAPRSLSLTPSNSCGFLRLSERGVFCLPHYRAFLAIPELHSLRQESAQLPLVGASAIVARLLCSQSNAACSAACEIASCSLSKASKPESTQRGEGP